MDAASNGSERRERKSEERLSRPNYGYLSQNRRFDGFSVKHPYGKKSSGNKVSSREYYPKSSSRTMVEASVRRAAQKIYSDNSIAFSRILQEIVCPSTITAELSGSLYGEEFINFRFKSNNTQETMSKKLSKLRAILSSLPAKAMVQIAPKEVQDYVSFTSEAGSLRLYKFLCPTAPLKLYDRTLTRRYENGTDIIEVNPSDSTRCAGLISDTILYPGQEIILEAETGLTGTVEARPLEDPSDPGESSK